MELSRHEQIVQQPVQRGRGKRGRVLAAVQREGRDRFVQRRSVQVSLRRVPLRGPR